MLVFMFVLWKRTAQLHQFVAFMPGTLQGLQNAVGGLNDNIQALRAHVGQWQPADAPIASDHPNAEVANTMLCLDAKILDLNQETNKLRMAIQDIHHQAAMYQPGVTEESLLPLKELLTSMTEKHKKIAEALPLIHTLPALTKTCQSMGLETQSQFKMQETMSDGPLRQGRESLQVISGDNKSTHERITKLDDKLGKLDVLADELKGMLKQLSIDVHVTRTEMKTKLDSAHADLKSFYGELNSGIRGLNVLVPNAEPQIVAGHAQRLPGLRGPCKPSRNRADARCADYAGNGEQCRGASKYPYACSRVNYDDYHANAYAHGDCQIDMVGNPTPFRNVSTQAISKDDVVEIWDTVPPNLKYSDPKGGYASYTLPGQTVVWLVDVFGWTAFREGGTAEISRCQAAQSQNDVGGAGLLLNMCALRQRQRYIQSDEKAAAWGETAQTAVLQKDPKSVKDKKDKQRSKEGKPDKKNRKKVKEGKTIKEKHSKKKAKHDTTEGKDLPDATVERGTQSTKSTGGGAVDDEQPTINFPHDAGGNRDDDDNPITSDTLSQEMSWPGGSEGAHLTPPALVRRAQGGDTLPIRENFSTMRPEPGLSFTPQLLDPAARTYFQMEAADTSALVSRDAVKEPMTLLQTRPFPLRHAPLAPIPAEQKQSETPPTSPTPPELKAFRDALQEIKAYIDDRSKVLQEVQKLLDTKTTPSTSTTPADLGPTLETALKPLSESLSTIDSATAGTARDLSNHMWESGGRHQAMETTLSGVHGMARDLQNRVGTTQRKLDDWVKSWSDSSGTTLDDSPGVVKCLCQLREHQDELARYNQATEALSSKVDSVADAVGAIATRVQNMQTLLDKMATSRPKAPPPAFPAPDIPATESAGPPPHQPPGNWHTSSPLPGSAPANPSPAPQGHPLTTPPAYIPSIGATIGAPQGMPSGANVINLSPPAQQDTVTVWMDGRAFQIPTTMVRGIN
ncbi:unnamed protein product [Symbiodinium microadriaticum]|nr:unnamed protein product [Symbiodinium microadriaticum]